MTIPLRRMAALRRMDFQFILTLSCASTTQKLSARDNILLTTSRLLNTYAPCLAPTYTRPSAATALQVDNTASSLCFSMAARVAPNKIDTAEMHKTQIWLANEGMAAMY